jgi:WD40 repeat protein
VTRGLIVVVCLPAALALCGCTIEVGSGAAPTYLPLATASGSLGLSGTIIYNSSTVKNNQLLNTVEAQHLADEGRQTIFEGPPDAWLDAAVVSSDNQKIIIAYAPPPAAANQWQEALYLIPMDGSQPPQLLFPPASATEQYFQPQWSPDGQYIYFVHANYETGQPMEIMRMRYPSGQPQVLATDSYWPRLSADGSRLVYVNIAPGSRVNRLMVAHPDGTDPAPVRVTALSPPVVIDAPMFSPDNQTIYFSAPIANTNYAARWTDLLFGFTRAKADGTIPSDWWTIRAAGGRPKRLTNIQTLALYGWFSPDGQHIASFSTDGIIIMNPDGTGVTLLSPAKTSTGTVDWIP